MFRNWGFSVGVVVAVMACGGSNSNPQDAAGCSSDLQCEIAGEICNVSTGMCVSATCTAVSTQCGANPADICCATDGAPSCVPGSCCGHADCGSTGRCVDHQCTPCSAASGNALYVDPTEHENGPETGADVEGCRFRSITRAMTAATSLPATIIHVRGTQPLTFATGEGFPIAVKPFVTVVGDALLVPLIRVPPGIGGFTLEGAGSVLSNLVIDGADDASITAGAFGVDSDGGFSTPPPALDHVIARNFVIGAILASGAGAGLSINSGTRAVTSGDGLRITGGATVTINGGTDPIAFSNNTNAGIRVLQGTLTATGTPGTGGSGTVVVADNSAEGVSIFQFTNVTLTGVTSWHNGGAGIRIRGGASALIRSCYVLNNATSGIDVVADLSSVVTGIDLGTTASFGRNVLQDATSPNLGAGICLETAGTLTAKGNTFSGRDCSQATPGQVTKGTACTSGLDIATTVGGTLAVDNCSQ